MEQMKTKTMAEIYLRQGHLLEAYEILRALAEQDPSDQEVTDKLRILRLKMGLVSSPTRSRVPSSAPPSAIPKEDRVEFLRKWLSNIQSRRKK
jgi:hypothetical protein